MRRRQQQGLLAPANHTRVMVICDPAGQRIGSGGATLCALTALLESLPGQSRADKIKRLKQMKIGLFHSGGDSQRLPTCSVRGKAFCGLPASSPAPSSAGANSTPGLFESTPLDFLIQRLASLQHCPGVLISATDCLLDFPADYPPIRAGSEESRGVIGCTVRTPRKLGSAHGVFVADTASGSACGSFPVTHILQKASQAELEAEGAVDLKTQTVLLDAGIIFLCPDATESLLALAQIAPFDSCCQSPEAVLASPNMRFASPPSKAFRFELYTDILLPMNPRMSRDQFFASAPPDPACPAEVLRGAREKLWDAMHPFKCFASVHPTASFFHMGTQQERMAFMFDRKDPLCVTLRQQTHFQLQAHACFDSPLAAAASRAAALLNCMLQSNPADDGQGITKPLVSQPSESTVVSRLAGGSFVEYSHLRESFSTEVGALISGVRSVAIGSNLHVPAQLCVQETQLHFGWSKILGVTDDLSANASGNAAGWGVRAAPPPTVVSIFHTNDSIKTPYTDAKQATFLGVSFQHFLASIARITGNNLESIVRRVWPHTQNDKQRTLWSARLFAIFQPAESLGQTGELPRFYPFHSDPALSMWLLKIKAPSGSSSPSASASANEGYPQAALLLQWLETPRASFQDVLACADGEAENLWREKLASMVDRRLLQQHLFKQAWSDGTEPKTVAGPVSGHSYLTSLLARARATHVLYPRSNLLQPLFRALDCWGVRCGAAVVHLDIAARICWLQGSLLQLLMPSGSDADAQPSHLPPARDEQLQLATIRDRLDLCDSSSLVRVLPWALASLAEARSRVQLQTDQASWTMRSELEQLRVLYAQCAAVMGKLSANQPSDIAFTDRVASKVPQTPVMPGSEVCLSGAVRLDLYGGWTDTPPVCFEHGGSVFNVALNIEGELPLRVQGSIEAVKAPSTAANAPVIIIQLSADVSDDSSRVELRSLHDLHNFGDPSAPGALVKCALLAMGIIRLADANGSAPNLEAQLTLAYWSGKTEEGIANSTPPFVRLHVSCWVALGSVSQGTGLGVSSILAADLVLLFARLFDRVYTPQAVAFLVLRVEQMLSTCGGWQDQVGGIWPGFKIAHSPRGLPLRLDVQPLRMDPRLIAEFNSHLLLVHTGMPRLARNLLRTVLDHWATRDPHLVSLFDRLEAGAPRMAALVARGAWADVGRMLSEYWSIKRTLATSPVAGSPPAEPAHVSAFLAATSSLVLGASLAGAGGGGFLALLVAPNLHDAVRHKVAAFNQEQTEARQAGAGAADPWVPYKIYKAAVCAEEGAQIRMEIKPIRH